MKRLIVALFIASCALAQTTTVAASANGTITDRQGNSITSGSVCWGSTSTSNGQTTYSVTSNYCFNITSGGQAAYVIPNATYTIWINEQSPVSLTAPNPLFVISNVTLTGTPLVLGSYLQGQFGLQIGSTYYYWQVGQSGLAETCNGNAAVLPGSPLPGARAVVKNTNATTACTVTTYLSGNPINGSTSIAAGAVWHGIWSGDAASWIVE